MNLYFAGEGYEEILGDEHANVLQSYYYFNDKRKKTNLKAKYGWKRLFIDSGAFSAFTQGVKINLVQYVWYIKKKLADHYAVLDVIGDAKRTYKNQKRMEELGVRPLPCFHYGEPIKYLNYYCNNYDYVCLGGMVPISTPELIKWLDVIFAKFPKQKFHGFGVTSTKIITDYPWHSVDSSTWIVHQKFNELNHYKLGRLYLGKDKNDFKKIIKDPCNFEWVNVASKYGMKIEDLFDDYVKRTLFNLKAFKEIEYYIQTNNTNKRDFQRTLCESDDCFVRPIRQKKIQDKACQRTLLNLNLCAKEKQIYYVQECVVCEKEFECNPEQWERRCLHCGDVSVTSPQERERWV